MTGPESLQRRVALAIHRYDNHHALSGNDIPSEHHRGEAEAALTELKPELDRLAEYEHTINWMTTCTGCARILDSAYAETVRAEKAEAAITRVHAALASFDDRGVMRIGGGNFDIPTAGEVLTAVRAALEEPEECPRTTADNPPASEDVQAGG